jgi:DNA repair protein RecN (Recombination protein N)
LAREVRRGGRNICRVNGHLTTLTVLQEVAEGLVDIHGQSDHLSLLKPTSHLFLLDRYGDLLDQRHTFSDLVKSIRQVRTDLQDLISNEQALKQKAEMLTYQVEEVEAADLKPGEEDELRDEARRLANAEQLTELTQEAYQAIFGGPEGQLPASDLVSQAANALTRLARIDTSISDLAELAENVSIQLEELGRSLSDYEENIEYDPGRLQTAELRLDLIRSLKRKYKCETIEELIESADKARTELDRIEHSEEHIQQLQQEEARLLAEIGQKGSDLSKARQKVARKLSKAVEAELADLRMDTAKFEVAVDQMDDPGGAPFGDYRVAFDKTGIDRVEFLISANLGEPIKPVARIASGGETSRIMLALKTVLSRADDTPTLIFDEIDAGIGGRIGAIIGHKLWSLAVEHQVLVVTHLPQLAGFGDAHFKVEKQTVGKRTVTRVLPLEHDPRVEELTAMLGAEAESARQSAQEILAYVDRVKKQAAPSAG